MVVVVVVMVMVVSFSCLGRLWWHSNVAMASKRLQFGVGIEACLATVTKAWHCHELSLGRLHETPGHIGTGE